MKYCIFSFFVLCTLFITPRLSAQKNIDGLIQAEKNFAAWSVAHGTREAFLRFLDSNGIVFEKGKAVNGIQSWTGREQRPGVLNWRPQYAEIALSGDLGYTTGPWTFQSKSTADTVSARGQYITVWHLNREGEWKFLVDLGVGGTPENNSVGTKEIRAVKRSKEDTSEMMQTERDFITAFAQSPSEAYQKYLSAQSILNRNGQPPATTASEQNRMILQTQREIKLEPLGHGFSGSGDMGFVYGTILLQGQKENYLHIWRREKTGWKLALEVLRG